MIIDKQRLCIHKTFKVKRYVFFMQVVRFMIKKRFCTMRSTIQPDYAKFEKYKILVFEMLNHESYQDMKHRSSMPLTVCLHSLLLDII